MVSSLALRWIVTPMPSRFFSITLARSSSSKGLNLADEKAHMTSKDQRNVVQDRVPTKSRNPHRIRSRLAIKLTFVTPLNPKIVANSHPITPAPTITALSGHRVQLVWIPSEVAMRFSSMGIPGGWRGWEPVARIMYLVVTE